MKLPKQAPAVERKINRLAKVPAGARVRPAAWPTDDWLERALTGRDISARLRSR